jgi:hypothetical protein
MARKNNRGDMPTQKAIFHYWEDRLFADYDRELHHYKTCFACLREGVVQRCHIKALAGGGINNSKNLHLLCPNCHAESEGYEGKFYWTWFENKDIIFLPMYRSLERGMLISKFASMIKKDMPHEYSKVLKSDNVKDIINLYDKYMKRAMSPHIDEKPKNTLF